MTFFLNPSIWGSKSGGPRNVVYAAQVFYEQNGMDYVDMGKGQFIRTDFVTFNNQLQGLVKQQKSLHVPQADVVAEAVTGPSPAGGAVSALWANLDEFDEQANVGFKLGDFDGELAQFVKERSYHNTTSNVLDYYASLETKYPTIARLARRYLCIPSSNVASESLWSLAGYISEDERSSTGAALIEAQLMVRRNYLECQNVKKALGIE